MRSPQRAQTFVIWSVGLKFKWYTPVDDVIFRRVDTFLSTRTRIVILGAAKAAPAEKLRESPFPGGSIFVYILLEPKLKRRQVP